MARQSKYTIMAEELYTKAGLNISARSRNRIDRISSFLKKNSKNSSKAEVFTDSNKVLNMKKSTLIGKTNATKSNSDSTMVYVGIK